MAWVAIFVSAKALKLEKYGVEIKPYSLVYKNKGVNELLIKILGKTRSAVSVFANVSVIAGFIMMGFAFWFLLNNISNFFVAQSEFSELTVLIPGVTLTSAPAIAAFLLSIPIVLVMHEGGHGIVAALEKIKIKTGGFAIFIAMFAGFVEPDEEQFEKAKKISKLRVIGAGATSNVLFSFVLGAILLTNPMFAMVVPEPLQSTFYEKAETSGVLVLSVMDGGGAQQAGIQENDIITTINDKPIFSPDDFPSLNPGDTASVSVLRDGQPLDFGLTVMAAPNNPEQGLIGIMRANEPPTPIYNVIDWGLDTPIGSDISYFLLWLWMISFFIGIINMLPLPILDGGKFIQIIIDKRFSDKAVKTTMWIIYASTFAIFGLNIALSYMKSGWFTI